MSNTILSVKGLKKYFPTKKGMLHAVDGVEFSVMRGKTMGIVGESGCGKSTTGRALLRLIEPTAGEVLFEGKNILEYNKKQVQALRKDMQIIFQDPFSSLDPRMSVGQIIAEPIKLNKLLSDQASIHRRISDLMEIVGLAPRLVNSYPHELDGGRRQRIGIARALSLDPKFIVCDEPVSALDVSIQAQILNLLKQLQEEMGLTYVFITHDLSVVNHFSDDIMVMYLGQVIERAPAERLFERPTHPYTQALLSAIPVPDLDHRKERIILKGEIVSPINLPEECRFAPRCIHAKPECRQGIPPLVKVGEDHFSACILA